MALASTRSLRRFVLPSDAHSFVGRIYDLSIVAYHFDSYEELSKHADAKYALDVNQALSMLTRRVESLNMVGDMIWPENLPADFKQFPLSRYEWLTVSADVFLMRYVSVVDCVLILINDVFECGLAPKDCTVTKLKKCKVPKPVLDLIDLMIDDQGELRGERNRRFHHGSERGFSSDDPMFRTASMFEHRANGVVDKNGKPIPVERYFRQGLRELQKEFNVVMRKLVRRLNHIYDRLSPEFEATFSPRFRSGAFAPKARTEQPEKPKRQAPDLDHAPDKAGDGR